MFLVLFPLQDRSIVVKVRLLRQYDYNYFLKGYSRILSFEAVDTVGFVVLSDQEVILPQDFWAEGAVEMPAMILSIVSIDAPSFRDGFLTQFARRSCNRSISRVRIPSSISQSSESRRDRYWNLLYNDVFQAHHVIGNRSWHCWSTSDREFLHCNRLNRLRSSMNRWCRKRRYWWLLGGLVRKSKILVFVVVSDVI